MSTPKHPEVLDVGQCDMDHGRIRAVLSGEFDAKVARAETANQAFDAVRAGQFALVLVNRLLDADGSEGIELIRRLRAHETTRDTPVMLVSNFPDAQAAAVSAGAEPGFGKASLDSDDTANLLARHLR